MLGALDCIHVRCPHTLGRLAVVVTIFFRNICCVIALVGAGSAVAQQSDQELAKDLANPIAALISVPFEFNYDEGFGTEDGKQLRLNIQPVVPITLNDNWKLISRTVQSLLCDEGSIRAKLLCVNFNCAFGV